MPQERTGKITTVDSTGRNGELADKATNERFNFEAPRAVPTVVVGDEVIFITVELGTGNVIAIVIKKNTP